MVDPPVRSQFRHGIHGRIDDPNVGWKGRRLWVSSSDRAPWQTEGGKGSRPMAVHFQVRPDPARQVSGGSLGGASFARCAAGMRLVD